MNKTQRVDNLFTEVREVGCEEGKGTSLVAIRDNAVELEEVLTAMSRRER
jgi:hypothetical protein